MATELYELSVQHTHMGQFVESVMHFEGSNLTADDTYNNGLDLVDSWTSNIMASWLDILPASVFLERVAARRATPKPSAVYHQQFQHTAAPGTRGSVAASYQLCPVIFLVPPMGTKSGGKIFVPAIGTGSVNVNAYTSAWATAATTLMTAMTSNFGANSPTWQSAIYSRKLGTWSLTQAWNYSTRFGFQSRRRSPVGS